MSTVNVRNSVITYVFNNKKQAVKQKLINQLISHFNLVAPFIHHATKRETQGSMKWFGYNMTAPQKHTYTHTPHPHTAVNKKVNKNRN